jgi:hypothetical protein
VLDVTGGGQLEEAGTGALANGITLLHERVTSIVSLSSIPSLEGVTQPSPTEFSLTTEENQ